MRFADRSRTIPLRDLTARDIEAMSARDESRQYATSRHNQSGGGAVGSSAAPSPSKTCGFCQGEPVFNGASLLDDKPRPALPCPRCGITTEGAPQ